MLRFELRSVRGHDASVCLSMRRIPAMALAACVLTLSAGELLAGPPVVPTEPLTPQEQIKKFHLPPGFEIQLVASEPEIQKPMNLNFDSRGRLWVSHSIEYPFPAEGPEPRDGLTILDGIGADGRATKVSRFADKLNIPIGVLPFGEGREALVWSIPHLWKLRDTDGDGQADHREILFGPYDYVDTHGNQNSLKLGLDGWVYACHGFRNDSKIRRKGEGPVVLELQSGNVYRFRPDGSEIEAFGRGQVNPFGSCFDNYGNFYTADCHSKPISLVLRGGYFESFGKPHDGLGFTPAITGNDHGSTGIAGIVFYDAPQFPAEYQHNLFVGNVVNSRVHRDVLKWRGSTPWVENPEDFLVCDDEWFHPVDLQIGPDGALYIADFYNCIIGHYEVDLKHPRRDRHRGRVWRVVWKGLDGKTQPPSPSLDLASLPTKKLFDRLGDANLVVRTAATNELAQRKDFINALEPQLMRLPADPQAAVQWIWAALRAGNWYPTQALKPVWKDPVVRGNWLRAVAELPKWDTFVSRDVLALLADAEPQVQRIAVEALGRHEDPASLSPLLELWSKAPAEDTMLAHAIKISLRNQLRSETGLQKLVALRLKGDQITKIAEIVLSVPSESAAGYLLDYIREEQVSADRLAACFTHIARHGGDGRLNDVAEVAQTKYRGDLSQQLALFQAIYTGLSQRGTSLKQDSAIGRWGASLAKAVLDPASELVSPWSAHPLDVTQSGRPFQNPWGVRNRSCADGKADVLFFDSIVNGEQLTGILRSRPFAIPAKFSFWICGHNGEPGTDPEPVNHIRLRLVDGGEEIARQVPPRNDMAQKVTWGLQAWAGRQGILEVVDADTGGAFAWLGVSRFEPPVVAQPSPDFSTGDNQLALAVRLVEQLKLTAQLPRVIALLGDRNVALNARLAAAQAVLRVDGGAGQEALQTIVTDLTEPVALRLQVAQSLGGVNAPAARTALAAALVGASGTLEQALTLSLASSPEGVDTLLDAIAAGKASPRLLQDPPIVERLKAKLNPDREQRIAELTADLAPPDERVRKLISERVKKFSSTAVSAEKGAALFKTHCAACHKIGDLGQKVGPQLDGIGQRGPERLLEDILDPNRNVDGAFRATIIATKAGLTISGLKLREEGQVTVLVDTQGKEQKIAADEIEEALLSPTSPMPSNFADTIPEGDFLQLLAYLLSQKVAAPAVGGK